MKYSIAFLVGAAFGALVALMFAPSSGEELRANIKTQADTQYARLKDDWQKGMSEIHSRMDNINSDLQALSSKVIDSTKTTG